MSNRLAETDAGIGNDAAARDAGSGCCFYAAFQKVVNFDHGVLIDWVFLHGARVALRVHENRGQFKRSRNAQAIRRQAQSRDVIENDCASRGSLAHDLGLARIGGKRNR